MTTETETLSKRQKGKLARMNRRLSEYFFARENGDYRRAWKNPTSKYTPHEGNKQIAKRPKKQFDGPQP